MFRFPFLFHVLSGQYLARNTKHLSHHEIMTYHKYARNLPVKLRKGNTIQLIQYLESVYILVTFDHQGEYCFSFTNIYRCYHWYGKCLGVEIGKKKSILIETLHHVICWFYMAFYSFRRALYMWVELIQLFFFMYDKSPL